MRQLTLFSAGLAIAGLAFAAGPAAAAEFGSIKGKFVIDGKAPELEPLVEKGENVKDGSVCAAEPVPNETLVVSPDGGVANVFLYADKVDEKDIHPDLKTASTEPIKFDQKNCVFIPHCVVIRTGQPVVLLNDDAVAHNVHTNTLRNQPINILIPSNERQGVEQKMAKPEVLPMPVKCDIHPWMQAHMLIVDHPYAVVSEADGSFEIKNLPAGKQTFKIWHELPGYVERKYEVTVKAGETTDLGAIKIPADKLKAKK